MPKKPPRRSFTLRIRLSEAERRAFEAAAEFAGAAMSSWCRTALRRTAAVELREVGKDSGL
jgi:uncharacterized protein (DUF1778 family)